MREYNATVGATDGNIIAAIITTQTDRNQPKVPSAVHGPSSMPRICPAVHHQPAAASAKSRSTRPRFARTAANAGASPPCRTSWSVGAITQSHRPRELGLRQARLAFVLDAEGVDPRSSSLRHREIRADRMEHAIEPDRLTGLDS